MRRRFRYCRRRRGAEILRGTQAGRPRGLYRFWRAGPTPNRDDVTSLRPPVGRARRHLDRIAHLFQAGAIRPPEIKLYRLSEAADAHRLSESRHFKGKLVFQVR
ncbi:MAG: zinc-binding dehydrogenase [Xanthobacteraceae bacterium]